MANIVHPLLTLLASLTRQELAQQIRYLKAENEILRSKLPRRVTLDNRERNTLVKHGKKLGGKIKDVMSIVSYSTFRRWVRNMEDKKPKPTRKSAKRGTGRPKIEEDVSDTILRIRKETGFGYTKILQEMRRMGVHVSRQTVKNVIVEAGLIPTPGDHPDTWHKFLKPPRTQLIRRESPDFGGAFSPGMAVVMRFPSLSTGHAKHRIRNSVDASLLTKAAVSRSSASG